MFVLPMFIKGAWKVPEGSKRTVFIRLEKHGSEPWRRLVETSCQLSVYCCDPVGGSGSFVHVYVPRGVLWHKAGQDSKS